MTEPNYEKMTSGEMYTALGADADKWAVAFCQFNPGADREMMRGWFVNAMMAMHDHGRGPISGDHAQFIIEHNKRFGPKEDRHD